MRGLVTGKSFKRRTFLISKPVPLAEFESLLRKAASPSCEDSESVLYAIHCTGRSVALLEETVVLPSA
jgi:hypothetical protein